MLRLRPYKACDAAAVARWLEDEKVFHWWGADRFTKYPLTPEDLNVYYEKEKNNDSFWEMTAFDEEGAAGHLIMRYPGGSKDEIRFGFIVVDSSRRGKGYGKGMLLLAIRYAFDILQADKITLGVFEENTAALNCYLSCGFRRKKTEDTTVFQIKGENWKCLELELLREWQ